MSTFEVLICKVEIQSHPNADAIELAKVNDYICIVRKEDFKSGELVAYIPEQSIVPVAIQEELGLVGRLSGGEKNRVKAIRLRGVLSQGLVYKAKAGWVEGQNVAEELGIKKWEPSEAGLPGMMRAKAIGVNQSITINYDIENIKKYNHLLQEGERVIMTEKIHGTFVQIGFVSARLADPKLYQGHFITSSKGQGARGILMDLTDDSSVYCNVATDPKYGLLAKLVVIRAEYSEIIGQNPVYICGEIFGPGIQKGFGYGLKPGEFSFRMFDIAYGERGSQEYLDHSLVEKISKDYEIPIVPCLYEGPFSKWQLDFSTTGKSVLASGVHMKEGVVVKPLKERKDSRAGRIILKSVSEQYLLRKGDTTEYN